MRSLLMSSLATMLVAVPIMTTGFIGSSTLTLQPKSRIWVQGTSTVRSFECTAGEIDALVETSGPGAVGLIAAGEKAVTTVVLKVPVAKLDCKNGTMNEHMLKALKAKEHPQIEFRFASYELTKADEGMTATLTGTLSMGGSEQPVTITASAREVEPGTLQVTGSHEVHMKAFGLKPPSLMLGTMKVRELVKVNFDLLLRG